MPNFLCLLVKVASNTTINVQFHINLDKEEKERKTKQIKKNFKKQKQKPKNKQDNDNLDEEASKKLPKKPLTAYIIYFQEKKPKFVEKHPGLNLSELTKLIAK